MKFRPCTHQKIDQINCLAGHTAQLDLTLVNNHHAGLRRCRALSVCNLMLILFIGSSTGVDRWGTGGGRVPPTFQRNCPPIFQFRLRGMQPDSPILSLHRTSSQTINSRYEVPIRKSTGYSAELGLTSVNNHHAGLALNFSGVINVPD